MSDNNEEYVLGHTYKAGRGGGHCGERVQERDGWTNCGYPQSMHADPGHTQHFIVRYPHEFVSPPEGGDHCAFRDEDGPDNWVACGYPESEHHVARPPVSLGSVVRLADVAQYARTPMPDAARAGITVTLIDGPTDPLGTLAVLAGIYEGRVARSKNGVTFEQRHEAWTAMQETVLNGPLESIQFTFLVEGVSRAITHQMVRNRFSFFAQESLRFAVAEDWAQEVPLPPALAGKKSDDPMVMVWRKALNQAEDSYAALVATGMPAEEARGLLPHAITTRLYWSVSLRTLLMEAGKRTCTQAQFDWRILFGGIAKAFRDRAGEGEFVHSELGGAPHFEYFLDNWQYELFAAAIRPVCYQEGKCGFMAKFDRGCTIRGRVDAFARNNIPSEHWDSTGQWDVAGAVPGTEPGGVKALLPIYPSEWAADPSAARVRE